MEDFKSQLADKIETIVNTEKNFKMISMEKIRQEKMSANATINLQRELDMVEKELTDEREKVKILEGGNRSIVQEKIGDQKSSKITLQLHLEESWRSKTSKSSWLVKTKPFLKLIKNCKR